MIYRSKVANHCRYGAFELKVKYRHNMLIGTFISALLAIATTAGAFLFTQSEREPVLRIRDSMCDSILVNLGKKIEIEPVRPNHGKSSHPPINIDGGKIIIVDDQIIGDEDVRKSSLGQQYFIEATGNNTEGAGSYIDQFDYAYLGNGGYEYPVSDSFTVTDVLAEMIYEFKPEYPRLAQISGMEGVVWIKALVDIDGSVKDALILISSGSKAGFDEAALRAAYFNKYRPAIYNGRPVPTWVSYKVEFVLESEL